MNSKNKFKILFFTLLFIPYTHTQSLDENFLKSLPKDIAADLTKRAKEQEDREEVTGRLTGSFSPLFWVHFPEAREILINAEVFNSVKNDAERRTYDDIFWKRMFNSTITMEANVANRRINEYMVGLDALLEAERIKAEIFNIEHDLWEY